MKLEEVIRQYEERKQEPSNADGLLDFIQQLYICGSIAIKEYRTLLREVSELGAKKPEYFVTKRIQIG